MHTCMFSTCYTCWSHDVTNVEQDAHTMAKIYLRHLNSNTNAIKIHRPNWDYGPEQSQVWGRDRRKEP